MPVLRIWIKIGKVISIKLRIKYDKKKCTYFNMQGSIFKSARFIFYMTDLLAVGAAI